MDQKQLQKKKEYIKSKIDKRIVKVRNIFMNLRIIINMERYNLQELEKKYKGIIRHEKIEDNNSVVYRIVVLDNNNSNKLKYEVKYSVTGVTIKITDYPYTNGIHFVHYSDFDCKNLRKIIYNVNSPDRIENFNIEYNSGEITKFERKVIEKKDKNWIGKLFKYLRDNKYLLD